MPVVRYDLEVMSARMVLMARCPSCRFCLNWAHYPYDEMLLLASCCGWVFQAKQDDDSPTQFVIRTKEADRTNVTLWIRQFV
jgi:hypothetical protein